MIHPGRDQTQFVFHVLEPGHENLSSARGLCWDPKAAGSAFKENKKKTFSLFDKTNVLNYSSSLVLVSLTLSKDSVLIVFYILNSLTSAQHVSASSPGHVSLLTGELPCSEYY